MSRACTTLTGMKVLKLLVTGSLLLLTVGCGGNAQGDRTKHPLTIEVQPSNATVWVREAKATPIAAALEQEGPLTSFDLPAGRYSYEVHAADHRPYRGEFSLPQNKELSVWLSAY